MSKQINVIRGAAHIITDGPSKLLILLSQHDEREQGEGRKHVSFMLQKRQGDRDFSGHERLEAVVVGALQRDPWHPTNCHDWILWVVSGGARFIMDYSTQTRVGSAREVKEFPSLKRDFILKMI